MSYGVGSVSGTISEDKLCFQRDNCLKDKLKFLLVSEAKDAQNYKTSGFMGLALENSHK